MLFIAVMLNRPRIIRWMIYAVNYLNEPLKPFIYSKMRLHRLLVKANAQTLVFFTRGDNVSILNRVMIYIEENEATKRLKIVHIANAESNNDSLKIDIEVLDRAYPDIDIDFLEIDGQFGPEIIDQLSKQWGIPKNFMFIGAPSNKFPYHVSELGGVRLIM